MRKKKELRDNAILKGDYPDAFIVEHLTPMRAKVAYKLRNDDTVERVWTIDGRLKVILKGTSQPDKPITVDSLEQLIQIPSWSKNDIEKLVFEAWNKDSHHGNQLGQTQGNGIRMNTRIMDYKKCTIFYSKYALLYFL